MTDEKLDELLADLICAAEDATEGNEWAREARAALVAHVREREVELMGLAMWYELRGADEETGPETTEQALTRWRGFPPRLREIWGEAARALRDAYDQAGAPREGEA